MHRRPWRRGQPHPSLTAPRPALNRKKKEMELACSSYPPPGSIPPEAVAHEAGGRPPRGNRQPLRTVLPTPLLAASRRRKKRRTTVLRKVWDLGGRQGRRKSACKRIMTPAKGYPPMLARGGPTWRSQTESSRGNTGRRYAQRAAGPPVGARYCSSVASFHLGGRVDDPTAEKFG
jgi:hypothetical protein